MCLHFVHQETLTEDPSGIIKQLDYEHKNWKTVHSFCVDVLYIYHYRCSLSYSGYWPKHEFIHTFIFLHDYWISQFLYLGLASISPTLWPLGPQFWPIVLIDIKKQLNTKTFMII